LEFTDREVLAAAGSALAAEFEKGECNWIGILSISQGLAPLLDPKDAHAIAMRALNACANTLRTDDEWTSLKKGGLAYLFFANVNVVGRMNVLLEILGPTERKSLGQDVVERMKKCESAQTMSRIRQALEAILTGVDDAEAKGQIEAGNLALAAKWQHASESEFITYHSEMDRWVRDFGPAAALALSTALLDAFVRIEPKGLSRIIPDALLSIAFQLDENGAREIGERLHGMMVREPRLKDDNALKRLVQFLDYRSGISKSTRLDGGNLASMIDQFIRDYPSVNRPLETIGKAYAGDPKFAQGIGQLMMQERDLERLYALTTVLLVLVRNLPANPWPSNIPSPHRLALHVCKIANDSPPAKGYPDAADLFYQCMLIFLAGADSMDADEARDVIRCLKDGLERSGRRFVNIVTLASKALRAVSDKHPGPDCSALAETIAAAVCNRKTSPSFRISTYDPLTPLLDLLDESRARHYARIALWQLGDYAHLDPFETPAVREKALLPFLSVLTMEDAVALLKDPVAHREKRELLLKRVGHLAGREFATVWDFVAWAEVNRPDLDLKSTYKPLAPEE
jgi:hypothetical protein